MRCYTVEDSSHHKGTKPQRRKADNSDCSCFLGAFVPLWRNPTMVARNHPRNSVAYFAALRAILYKL
jgi:hypothetical protein